MITDVAHPAASFDYSCQQGVGGVFLGVARWTGGTIAAQLAPQHVGLQPHVGEGNADVPSAPSQGDKPGALAAVSGIYLGQYPGGVGLHRNKTCRGIIPLMVPQQQHNTDTKTKPLGMQTLRIYIFF